ncbi:MAG: hypothetical protein JWQ71_1673 [Pedosphaera sp.]|nr:hypothetical protein [Pedosphaera sp.]
MEKTAFKDLFSDDQCNIWEKDGLRELHLKHLSLSGTKRMDSAQFLRELSKLYYVTFEAKLPEHDEALIEKIDAFAVADYKKRRAAGRLAE